MAYQAPGVQQQGRGPTPSFSRGYATYQQSQGRDYWRHLSVAFAPFLGPTTDPTKLLFGHGVRTGTNSFSGGRSAQGALGWGWEFTSTTNKITCGTALDAFPVRNGSAGSFLPAMTVLIGYRKTDGTNRNTNPWGTGASNLSGFGLRYGSASDNYILRYGGTSCSLTPAAGFVKQSSHVYAVRGPTSTARSDAKIWFDGETVAINGGASADALSGDLIIGSGAGGDAGDLMIVDFLYVFNEVLSDTQVLALTADPTILFRPEPDTLSNSPKVQLAGSIAGVATVSNLAVLAAAGISASLSDAATVTISMGGTAQLLGSISGTATPSIAIAGLAPMATTIAGVAVAAMAILGSAEIGASLSDAATVTIAMGGSAEILGSISGTATPSLAIAGLAPITVTISGTATPTLNIIGLATTAGSTSGSATAIAAVSKTTSLGVVAAGLATATLDLTPVLTPVPFISPGTIVEGPAMGARNDGAEDILRRHLNPGLHGPGWDALIAAFAAGNSANLSNAELAADQLAITSASGKYLDRVAGDRGIGRPAGIGMSDDAYRQLTIKVANRKLTQQAILDVLEVFYGSEAVRAHVVTDLFEPYSLVVGDTLSFLFDESQPVQVVLTAADATNLGFTRAIEVAAVFNRAFTAAKSQAYALAVTNTTTGLGAVRVYSGSAGTSSSVRITGGTAQRALRFPTSLFTVASFTPITWTVSASPTAGRVRYATSSSSRDLSTVREGDYVNVSGSGFLAHTLTGSYPIVEVSITGSGQHFEVENEAATGLSASITQTSFDQVLFFRPTKYTLYNDPRRAIVSDSGQGLVDVVMPVTTGVVSRTATKASYLHTSGPIAFSGVSRTGSGHVTITTNEAHNYSVGDLVVIDSVLPDLVVPPPVAPPLVGGNPIVQSYREYGLGANATPTFLFGSNQVHRFDALPHITKVVAHVIGEIVTGSAALSFEVRTRATPVLTASTYITLPNTPAGPGYFHVQSAETAILSGTFLYDWYVSFVTGSGTLGMLFLILEIS